TMVHQATTKTNLGRGSRFATAIERPQGPDTLLTSLRYLLNSKPRPHPGAGLLFVRPIGTPSGGPLCWTHLGRRRPRRSSSASDLNPGCSRSHTPSLETDLVGKSRRGPAPSPSIDRTTNSCSCR